MTIEEFLDEWNSDSDTLLVHTSGSTGKPKPMRIEKRRMVASARITCRFLGLHEGDTALLCMPLDYIAGKMMVVRALTCGLRLLYVPPGSHPLGSLPFAVHGLQQAGHAVGDEQRPANRELTFAAMVPMQVYNSLQVPEERERLRQIRHLIVGGGAVDDALARELRGFPNAVWSTYGMTETLSHIALRRLSGPDATDWYRPFPSVKLSLNADGCLVIDAPDVHEGPLTTNDMAELRPDQTFRILGRRDNVVCSGGIKIQIEEVERLLQQHVHVPFMVSKCPDPQLGEALVLLTAATDTALLDALPAVCRRVLPRYWVPRHYWSVGCLPMTATGKPARKEAEQLAVRCWRGRQ